MEKTECRGANLGTRERNAGKVTSPALNLILGRNPFKEFKRKTVITRIFVIYKRLVYLVTILFSKIFFMLTPITSL